MGLFGNPRNNKTKWASVVMPSSSGNDVPVSVLEEATEMFVEQHRRILYDSIKLFLTSKNPDTRKSRYELACKHYGDLSRVRKYTDKQQRRVVDKTIDDFVKADDVYRHPNRAEAIAALQSKKQKKDDFWEGFAMTEMIEIFSEDFRPKRKE